MLVSAAVVRSFSQPPHFETIEIPDATGPHQVVVQVLAAGLHPRVRSSASGTHYTSTGSLPMVPGIDGVGRLADGTRIYFVAPDEALGTMAEKAVADLRRSVPLPDEADAVTIAAAMNPAMSAWVALRRRVPFQPGQSVLILGATGSAGQMAIQVARRLGAGRVIAAGRDQQRLESLRTLGADEVVAMGDTPGLAAREIADAASEVDVVIDYLWGAPAEETIVALLTRRADRSRALDWIQIGSVAGPTIQLPSEALRSANFRLLGNGQGAVSLAGYVAELPSLIAEITGGMLRINAVAVPLANVEEVWNTSTSTNQRIVIMPTYAPADQT